VGEEKLGQWAGTRRLTAIYAQAFLRCRSGSRPHVGALEAVDPLTIKRQGGRDNWGGAAAIPGVFDPSDQEGRLRMVAERLDDRALRRLSKQWLNAGGLDTDGPGRHPPTRSPHGGTVAPLLANVSWPYALDLWGETGGTRHGHGAAGLSRSADGTPVQA
jgi:hypothetical protein